MKNFCTDIQETARLRGLERERRISEDYTREIEITITYEDIEDSSYSNNGLMKIFSEIKPKEPQVNEMDIISNIIKQFIN